MTLSYYPQGTASLLAPRSIVGLGWPDGPLAVRSDIVALAGATGTIRRWGPKLAVAASHRPSDLWRVPALIHTVDPAYRVYLRQHDGGVIETVAYGVR